MSINFFESFLLVWNWIYVYVTTNMIWLLFNYDSIVPCFLQRIDVICLQKVTMAPSNRSWVVVVTTTLLTVEILWCWWPLPIVAAADQSRLSVWLVDGDLYCRGLLKFALTEENFAHSCVLLVASLTRPWDILDSLTRWSDVLSTHVQRLKLPPNLRRQQEDDSMDIFLITF